MIDQVRIRSDFPDPRLGDRRPPDGFPRLGLQLTETGPGDRRHDGRVARLVRQRASGCQHPLPRSYRGLRRRPPQGGPVPQRRRPPRRWSSPAAPPRRSTCSPTGGASGNLKPGDRVLISVMEHHSNIVPWHIIARHTGAELSLPGHHRRLSHRLGKTRRLLRRAGEDRVPVGHVQRVGDHAPHRRDRPGWPGRWGR